LSSWIANEYNRRVQEGEIFTEEGFYDGFLNGFEVCFKPVAKREFNSEVHHSLN